jgi:hypothetical protein
MKEGKMKVLMRDQQLTKPSVKPAEEVEPGPSRATSLAVVAQVAIALVVAITVGAIVESDHGTLAAHDFPDSAPASTSATTTAQSADSGAAQR